jgi:hypothetical protein
MAAELMAQHVPPGKATKLPSELIIPETGPPMLNGFRVAEEFATALENRPVELASCVDVPPPVPKSTEPLFASGVPPGEACAETPKSYDSGDITPPVGVKLKVCETS